MIILGISALYHDAAAALVVDGDIVAAAQEERFTRKKHDNSFPLKAIKYCLNKADVTIEMVDYISFYDNPLITLDRYLNNLAMIGADCQDLINGGFESLFSKKIWIHKLIRMYLNIKSESKTKIMVTKHHIAHAASAFFPSPYERSAVMTIDGVGEWTTLSIGYGDRNNLKLIKEIRYPHSLGLFYSAFTYFCGFKVNSGDYKFMGLAPYGVPRFYRTICENIIDIKEDGSFALNLQYFDYQNGRTMINESNMSSLFEGGRRIPESQITQREMDIATSVQMVTEEIILKLARTAKKMMPDCDCLTLAGGVALNCVANGKLVKENIFSNIWIQPAAGDAGGALGAALYTYYHYLGHERNVDGVSDFQKGSYLGPEYTDYDVREFCKNKGFLYHECNNIAEKIAELLASENVIGLFSGRMEYGPRALGHRSIIADPRSEKMQSKLNLKIKYRESFRPFAPSVIKEDVEKYFDFSSESPYMLVCSNVKQERCIAFNVTDELKKSNGDMLQIVNKRRSDIPAITHVDYSARLQTVDGQYNREYYEIISAFKRKTGCSVIINTSFNVRGEPIVCSLEDAYKCFMRTEMDVLVLGNIVLYKEEQSKLTDDDDWRNEYVLD